jgi:hypothetical protein
MLRLIFSQSDTGAKSAQMRGARVDEDPTQLGGKIKLLHQPSWGSA